MRIDKRYQIWNAALSDRKEIEQRPTLGHVRIEASERWGDVAVAADGFILAIVPVTLEEGDLPGNVNAAMLAKAIAAGAGFFRQQDSCQIDLGEETIGVMTVNGRVTFPRCRPDVSRESTYANYLGLVPDWPAGPVDQPALALRTEQTTRLAKALGHDTLCLTPTGKSTAVIVEALDHRSIGPSIEPPFGLQMPMYVQQRTWRVVEPEPVETTEPVVGGEPADQAAA